MAEGIKRRGILGLLAAIPMAGPSLAQDVTGRNLLGLGASTIKSLHDDDGGDSDDGPEDYVGGRVWEKQNVSRNYMKKIEQIVPDHRAFVKKPLSEYIRRVDRLDADLQSNRSLSLSAKVREQARRNQSYDNQHHHRTTLGLIKQFRGYMRNNKS